MTLWLMLPSGIEDKLYSMVAEKGSLCCSGDDLRTYRGTSITPTRWLSCAGLCEFGGLRRGLVFAWPVSWLFSSSVPSPESGLHTAKYFS